MKYNCENEFDLNEIYRKLTSTSKVTTVKASEFFVPQKSALQQMKERLNKLFGKCPSVKPVK